MFQTILENDIAVMEEFSKNGTKDQEGGVDFHMADIDRLSRRVPHLCKVAPSTAVYHVEDVHRAGGIMGILGELDRAGLIDTSVGNVLCSTLGDELAAHDIARPGPDGAPGSGVSRAVRTRYLAAPAGARTTVMFSQASRWDCLSSLVLSFFSCLSSTFIGLFT